MKINFVCLLVLGLSVCVTSSLYASNSVKKNVNEMKTKEVSPYGKFFEADGLEVEMAVFQTKNPHNLYDVILKLRGQAAIEEGIDGKAIKYTSEPAGTGVNMIYFVGGETKVRMMTRSPWGADRKSVV